MKEEVDRAAVAQAKIRSAVSRQCCFRHPQRRNTVLRMLCQLGPRPVNAYYNDKQTLGCIGQAHTKTTGVRTPRVWLVGGRDIMSRVRREETDSVHGRCT